MLLPRFLLASKRELSVEFGPLVVPEVTAMSFHLAVILDHSLAESLNRGTVAGMARRPIG